MFFSDVWPIDAWAPCFAAVLGCVECFSMFQFQLVPGTYSLHMFNSGKPSYGSGKPISLQLNPIHADVVLGTDLSWFFMVFLGAWLNHQPAWKKNL